MATDVHLELARGLLTTLADVLADQPVKTWSPAGVELAISLLRLVRQALGHAAEPSAVVPLLERIEVALQRDKSKTPLKALVRELRAEVGGGREQPRGLA
jgi:hypothetical protein